MEKDYLSAKEAMALLDIRQQTLYAYVSRGWVRSITQPGTKSHLYLREDIEKMRARSQARAGHGAVAATAMNWGNPIIATSITEITPKGPLYRGRLATQLARSGASYETVAELLWTGIWHEDPIQWSAMPTTTIIRKLNAGLVPPDSNDQLLEMFALFALQLGMPRGSVAERVRSGKTLEAAREIIQVLTGCFGYISPSKSFYSMTNGQSIVDGLIGALSLSHTQENRENLEAMLILFADHELSPGAFAARVAASSGASLNSCVVSAICTSSGIHVGRLYDRVEEFLSQLQSRSALFKKAQNLQARGSAVPGFEHPLYPHGDPRCKYILELVKRRQKQSKQLEAIYGFIEDAETKLNIHPRHELSIMTLSIAMGLPGHCAGALFSLARTAGWVAHVQEQRLSGGLLRPRAKFVGHASIN